MYSSNHQIIHIQSFLQDYMSAFIFCQYIFYFFSKIFIFILRNFWGQTFGDGSFHSWVLALLRDGSFSSGTVLSFSKHLPH